MKNVTNNTIDTTLTTGKPIFTPKGIKMRQDRFKELNSMISRYENQESVFRRNENDINMNHSSENNFDYEGITSESQIKYLREVQALEIELIEPQVIPYPKRVSEVCIGCTVNILMNGQERQYEILGYGETNLKNNQLAYTAPIAKGILGKKSGYVGEIQLCGKSQRIEIIEVAPLKELVNYQQ